MTTTSASTQMNQSLTSVFRPPIEDVWTDCGSDTAPLDLPEAAFYDCSDSEQEFDAMLEREDAFLDLPSYSWQLLSVEVAVRLCCT